MKLWILGIPVVLLTAIVSCGERRTAPRGSGLIEATEVTISAETGGRLISLFLDEGQSANAGDTIAMIDTLSVKLKLRQAKAAGYAVQTKLKVSEINIKQAENNRELAEKEFNRVSVLIKTGSANQQQYDQAETARNQAAMAREQADASLNAAQADLENARAQIELIQKQVDDCFPTSPIYGKIVEKFMEPGELVAAGKPLVRIARLDTVWVKIYLTPADLTRITLGGQASVDPEDGHTAPLEGIISWISSEAEFTPKNVQTKEARAGLLYAVKITMANPAQVLKIGMPVLVTIK